DTIVALKVLHTRLAGDTEALKRFKNEAAAAARLKSDHAVKVISFGVTYDSPYLAMELIEGQSLSQLLGELGGSGRLSSDEIVDIFEQCCDGLADAHQNGVVHRDIKPGNILLTSENNRTNFVKIADFGIAKLMPGEGQPLQHLTQTGQIFGSPAYMSPEQCQGKHVDVRADIYSLGCVLYETVTGVPPFGGENVYEVMMNHLNAAPPPF